MTTAPECGALNSLEHFAVATVMPIVQTIFYDCEQATRRTLGSPREANHGCGDLNHAIVQTQLNKRQRRWIELRSAVEQQQCIGVIANNLNRAVPRRIGPNGDSC